MKRSRNIVIFIYLRWNIDAWSREIEHTRLAKFGAKYKYVLKQQYKTYNKQRSKLNIDR